MVDIQSNDIERRKYCRIDLICKVNVRVLGINKDAEGVAEEFKNEVKSSVNRDMSIGGVRIVYDKSLPVGTIVELEIIFPHELGIIVTQGEVRWCAPENEEKNQYMVGIQFNSPDEDVKRLLIKYVTNNWNKE